MEKQPPQDLWAQAAHEGMGTRMAHKAYGENAQSALKDVQKEMKRLEKLLSRFEEKSDIGRINLKAGSKPVKISRETFALLNFAQEISKRSGGAFDITVGPLVSLWDVRHAFHPPKEEDISKVMSLIDYESLVLDADRCTAMLIRKGQSIDLGGVAKGYASDRAMALLKRRGIRSAYTNIGGNVSTLETKPDGSPWQVGIRHPRLEGQLLGAVDVKDMAVVTSGDYERYFVDPDGKRRHHLLNPLTGYPAESGLISVTVIHPSAMLADALSTAVFVLGMDKGMSLLKGFLDANAVLVADDLTVYTSQTLQEHFTPARNVRAETGTERKGS